MLAHARRLSRKLFRLRTGVLTFHIRFSYVYIFPKYNGPLYAYKMRLNVSGQYNFTSRHFCRFTHPWPPAPGPVHPRLLPLRKQSSGLVRGNPWSPSWGWTLRIGPFRHNSLPAVWNHCDPPSRVTQGLTSRTSQKAMPGNEWGGLQTNEISHFSIDGVPDRSTVGTH